MRHWSEDNAGGLPRRTEITARQTSDHLGFDLDIAINLPTAGVMQADRGYDADSRRKSMGRRDVLPLIPGENHARYASGSTAPSTAYAIWSSGASTNCRTAAMSLPATTRPQRVSAVPSTLPQSGFGPAICQQVLTQVEQRRLAETW
jgi:hypothetical protein